MRTEGDFKPDMIRIEPCMSRRGYVEVRLTENTVETTRTETETDTTHALWQYDEYVIHALDRENLMAEIEANIDEWMDTGRGVEVNSGASIVHDMNTALATLGYTEGSEA